MADTTNKSLSKTEVITSEEHVKHRVVVQGTPGTQLILDQS